MTWLIFVLGAGMSLAGIVSIVSGAPYTRFEWGWTEIIAGATVASSGALVLAIGALLLKLDALRRSIDARGGALAPLAAAPEGMSAANAWPPGQDDESPEPYATGAEAGDGPASEPLFVALAAPDDSIPARPAPAEPPPARRVSMLTSFREKVSRGKSDQDPLPPLPQPVPVEPRRGASYGDPPRLDAAASLDPVLTLDAAAGFAGPPSLAVDQSPERQRSFASPPPAPAADEQDHASAERGGPAVPYGSQAPTAPEPPTVVGRYQAGGASYVLYSDGTIEVETDAGIHRFASMRDLKTFLERAE